jgi:LPS export ABC transporter protein LptC
MKTILIAVLLVLAVGAGAFWLSGTNRGTESDQANGRETPDLTYNYEAREVVVQQMDEAGHLLYQVEAQQIVQLPDNGRIAATGLTMHHDPPGTSTAGPYRWTLTAMSADLPAEGGKVSFQGRVRARGRLQTNNVEVQLSTEQLDYDLDAGVISSDAEVALQWGKGVTGSGRPLRVNIKQGLTELGDMSGSFTP